jgi:hypothetical protein
VTRAYLCTLKIQSVSSPRLGTTCITIRISTALALHSTPLQHKCYKVYICVIFSANSETVTFMNGHKSLNILLEYAQLLGYVCGCDCCLACNLLSQESTSGSHRGAYCPGLRIVLFVRTSFSQNSGQYLKICHDGFLLHP